MSEARLPLPEVAKKPSIKTFTLSERQRNRIMDSTDLQYSITRNLVYKELMEWKRRMYVEADDHLGVAGDVWKQMTLTTGDITFINAQVKLLLLMQPDEDLLEKLAAKIHKVLSSKIESLTPPQRDLKKDLENALTINEDEGLR